MLARSLDEYLHRALAEEEHSSGGGGGSTADTQAAGSDGAQLYEPGAFGRSGLPTLEAYLTRKVGPRGAHKCGTGGLHARRWAAAAPSQNVRQPVSPRAASEAHTVVASVALSGLPMPSPLQAGMFPDVAERLANAHLAKGDTMSALITGAA